MPAKFRNEDLTDRELLHTIADTCGKEGVASSDDIGLTLGLQPDEHGGPGYRLASRLSWMKRYGFLERVDAKTVSSNSNNAFWRITPIGQELMGGRLPPAMEGVIGRANAGSQLLMMRALSRKAYAQQSRDEVATAIRREYLHQAAQRGR